MYAGNLGTLTREAGHETKQNLHERFDYFIQQGLPASHRRPSSI
jgi:hypothetical protein